MVANSVANINEKRQMPVLIVNTTNRTYKFRRGIAIGRASPVLEENVVSLESTQEHSEIENVFETDLNVPDVHRAYPDLKKPYVLYTDASNDTIGACLTQPCEEEETHLSCLRKEKPIYFLSHKLSDTQSRWSTIEKEAFSIHYALQKLDHYLHGAEFIIRTDHTPLKYLLLSPQCNKKLQLWALGIASYNCKIEWLAGTDNTIADYLSRRPPGQEGNQNQSETIEVDISDKAFQINTLNSNEFNPKDFASCDYKEDDQLSVKECTIPGYDMKIEQSLDIELSEIINQINTGKASRSVDNKHIIINDILYYISHPDDDLKLRLYVPLQLRNEVIKSYHDNLSHLGIDKCHDSIRQKYFWPKLYKELNSYINSYINSCVICQSQSAGKTKPLLQISDIPPFPFAKIGVDLSGPYPTSLSGNKDPVLSIDNQLKPRRKYVGEDPHKILLEQQHKSFILVHRNLKKSKEKQKQNADKNRQEINLEIGDPVYFKNHLRKSKLDTKWKPYYRIIEKTSPVTFVLKNQLDGSVAKKVHLEHLKKAKIDEWVIPTNLEGRQLRKTNYVVPPEDSDESDSELPVANPRERLINRYRQERETSSDEDDIPLAELKQKIANRNRRENEEDKSSVTSGSSEMSDNNSSDGYNSDRSQKMSVDEPREFSNREVQIVTRYLGGDQMVSTNVEGDGTASRDVKIASAPLQEPATKNHYPVLDIGFDYWTQRRRLDVHKTIRSHNLYW
ncbi:Hypothetical predicted protein [Mytilus galloprovincialis]|uniref:Uncharacterized protein n=1 Tax=Mytilus galloprovincialis TaxID=29158 RepID=A0A8B6F5H4_MYTGA|nr:Hypothetical predicted protein [Mytilus galloprovincialis]